MSQVLTDKLRAVVTAQPVGLSPPFGLFSQNRGLSCYLGLLKEDTDTHARQIHVYVLMSNHAHLLVSARNPANLSKLPQHVGRKCGPYFNREGFKEVLDDQQIKDIRASVQTGTPAG